MGNLTAKWDYISGEEGAYIKFQGAPPQPHAENSRLNEVDPVEEIENSVDEKWKALDEDGDGLISVAVLQKLLDEGKLYFPKGELVLASTPSSSSSGFGGRRKSSRNKKESPSSVQPQPKPHRSLKGDSFRSQNYISSDIFRKFPPFSPAKNPRGSSTVESSLTGSPRYGPFPVVVHDDEPSSNPNTIAGANNNNHSEEANEVIAPEGRVSGSRTATPGLVNPGLVNLLKGSQFATADRTQNSLASGFKGGNHHSNLQMQSFSNSKPVKVSVIEC